MQRALLRYFAMITGKRGPKSVALKSAAKGFVEVNNIFTTEQKVDKVFELLVNKKMQVSSLAEVSTASISAAEAAAVLQPAKEHGKEGDDQIMHKLTQLGGQVQKLTEVVEAMALQMKLMKLP